jgi:PilZ domain
MLVWILPVRLLDVSRGGCLVEVGRHLETGTSGQLQLEMDGVLRFEDIRVCRCQMREGASRVHYAGVELLRTRRLSRRSLRLAIRRIIGEHRAPFAAAFDESARRDVGDERGRGRTRDESRAPPALAETET